MPNSRVNSKFTTGPDDTCLRVLEPRMGQDIINGILEPNDPPIMELKHKNDRSLDISNLTSESILCLFFFSTVSKRIDYSISPQNSGTVQTHHVGTAGKYIMDKIECTLEMSLEQL